MIQIGIATDENDGHHVLTVNGRVIADSSVNESRNYSDVTLGESVKDAIGPLAILELLSTFWAVYFSFDDKAREQTSAKWAFSNVRVHRIPPDETHLSLEIDVAPDYENWDRPFSVRDFEAALGDFLSQNRSFGFHLLPRDDSEMQFRLLAQLQRHASIADIFTLLDTLTELRAGIENHVSGDLSNKSLSWSFNFPPSIKAACEQYLVYFAQFLRDLGIEAETHLTERAKTVLFSVTPADKTEALDAIVEALAAYLRLPSAPGYYHDKQLTDVAVIQLLANIHHLQGQVALGQAQIRLNEATIAAQQSHIAGLEDRLNLVTYIPAKDSTTSGAPPESEALIGNLVTVKPYDFKFVSVNIPEILRKLKRRFQ